MFKLIFNEIDSQFAVKKLNSFFSIFVEGKMLFFPPRN